VAVRLRGEMRGALCFEQVGPPRRWSDAEQVFAGALADVVSLALEGAERARVESALEGSERQFRDLFLHTSDATLLYRVALDGTVYCEDFNPAAEAGTGLKREDLVGKTVHEVLEAASADKLTQRYAQAIRSRAPLLYEHDLQLPVGRRWYSTAVIPLLDEAGRVYRLAAIARDVTAQREAEGLQRKLEAELAESQKNEALARLASHIAHDFNNLLTVISAHTERLTQLGGKPAEVAQSILKATTRGRDLTQQVLTFGRRRPPERKPLELAPIIRETTKLLEATAPGVSMRLDLPLRSTKVLGDSGQLHQVVTNLCTNALAAMGTGAGTLTVRLKTVELDYAFAKRHPPLQAGRWVVLAVEDTGLGMDELTRRRIFEPFFSTRADGRGTGLGLAVVQSIVQGHEGAIVVETSPGLGSVFQVYLPALEEDTTRPGSGQHLMLVDDHPGMARVSAKLLETLGYRTSVFDDPREALAAFRAAPKGFDAVLTDLSMPQMSGEEFTRSVRELAPQVPVIVSSGLASELDFEELRQLGVSAILMKPWRLEEAVATLQRVLP
jgi:PAS domain S-box-containing protein